MEAGSSEEPPPPKPRRAGSFHPKSVRIRDDSLEEPLVDDALEAPPEPPAAAAEPDADPSPVSASRLLLFLTLCPVLIAALVAALLVLDRKEPWVWLWVCTEVRQWKPRRAVTQSCRAPDIHAQSKTDWRYADFRPPQGALVVATRCANFYVTGKPTEGTPIFALLREPSLLPPGMQTFMQG